MSEIKKASKDVFIYTLVNVIPIMLGFISIPIYTRIFDPAEYGQLSIVQMTANYTVIFMLTWISSSFLRFYEAYKKKDKEKEFVNTYLILLLLIVPASALLYGVFLLLAWQFRWFDTGLFKLFIIGTFLLFFNGLINFIQTYYRTKRESISFATISISNSILTLSAGLIFVLVFKYRVDGILIGSTAISALIGITALTLVIKKYGINIKMYNKKIVREALSYGLPVIFSGFAAFILRFSDRYIIEFTRNTYEVGLYSVSYNISEKTIMLIITVIALAVSPILISTWEHKGKRETEKLLRHFSRYQFMLLLPGTVGLVVLAPSFMNVFVGSEFLEGVFASQIVAIGVFFLGLYNLTNTGLYIEKKTRIIARNNLFVGVVNISLNLILVPLYGYLAAAVNTVLSYFLLWLISYFQTRNILRWGIDRVSFIKISSSALAMGVFLYFFSSTAAGIKGLLAIVACAIVIYSGLLLLSGELSREARVIFNSLKRRIKNV